MSRRTQERGSTRIGEIDMPTAADLVLLSRQVFTGNADQTEALAVGISEGKIVWVADIDAYGTEHTPLAADARIKDFGDAFIMPGFHDAHMHVFHSALYSSALAAHFVGANELDCVRRMESFAKTRPHGSWLLSQGWREYLWDPPVLPTRASLDAALPDRLVAMYSGDAHTLWLNSCALETLDIDEESIPPQGGSYDRDTSGRLTGIVRESAAMEIMPKIMASFTDEELMDAYEHFASTLVAQGITSICDMALTASPGADFVRDDLYTALVKQGRFPLRVNMYPTLTDDLSRADAMARTYRGPQISMGGCKQFFDGVSSQHTAWLHDPYTNAKTPDDVGRPTIPPDILEHLVDAGTEHGHAIRIHTIGDEAIHEALDIYERVRQAQKDAEKCEVTLTLEHLENLQREDLDRFSAHNVIASVQPRHMTLDPEGPLEDLGVARTELAWPLRTLLERGATLAFGTDSPVVEPDPFANIYTAITRKDATTRKRNPGFDERECISVSEALRAYTAGSAQAAGKQDELGVIAPGYWADIIVLDRNPLTIDPEDILETKVDAVFIGGNLVNQT